MVGLGQSLLLADRLHGQILLPGSRAMGKCWTPGPHLSPPDEVGWQQGTDTGHMYCPQRIGTE